jgi:hypothetical protein
LIHLIHLIHLIDLIDVPWLHPAQSAGDDRSRRGPDLGA